MKKWLCPQISAYAISPGQKWWPTVLEIEISCSQWEGSTCTHERSSFFLLGGGGGIRDFFVLFLLFPSSSQCVPTVVPPRRSQQHLGFIPYSLPKFNSPVYKLKRWNPGVQICFNLQLGVQRGASIEGMPNVPKKLLMGQSLHNVTTTSFIGVLTTFFYLFKGAIS
jgi:hypothetical protein